MSGLLNKVAIVTGGNGGIGRAIAIGLAEAGSSVAILARNPEKNADTLKALQQIGRPSRAIQLDVTDHASLPKVMAQVESELGPVDILVNNAGVVDISGGVLLQEKEAWEKTLSTNVTAPFALSKLAATSMAARNRGKIINIASMYSHFGSSAVPSYSVSKGAIVQLTRSMAIELAPRNIQVNAIAPGWIATDMTAIAREDADWADFNAMLLARTPAGRWGEPDDCAGAAVFLASDAANFITGVTLPVDGGYSIF